MPRFYDLKKRLMLNQTLLAIFEHPKKDLESLTLEFCLHHVSDVDLEKLWRSISLFQNTPKLREVNIEIKFGDNLEEDDDIDTIK